MSLKSDQLEILFSVYWGVKLFMVLYVKTALLYFNRFTIGSQLKVVPDTSAYVQKVTIF